VELFAKLDSVMAEHLTRIHDKDTHVHYVGRDIQNQLIQIISEAAQEEILENLKTLSTILLLLTVHLILVKWKCCCSFRADQGWGRI
jgi:hypothetical protein